MNLGKEICNVADRGLTFKPSGHNSSYFRSTVVRLRRELGLRTVECKILSRRGKRFTHTHTHPHFALLSSNHPLL